MSVFNQSEDDAMECPLCMEPLEVDDLNFFPCTCGYQICRFCWHRIRTDENELCPACRKAYSENPADFKPLTKEELSRLKAEKRLKGQQKKQRVTENRKHLANVRVVQKNLVFVVGLPMRLADADVLKRHEYFGKFGKIHKVVINQSTSYAGSQGPSASAYVTYQRQEDALRAIEAVNNITVDGRTVKTSLGTTKYCSHFMRNQPCPKTDCMYLHDLGDQEASFTKEEMHQGKHQEYERKLVQSLNVNPASFNRKPTISPPVNNSSIRENGTIVSQTKEAWPSLQLCTLNNVISEKNNSSPIQAQTQQFHDNKNITDHQKISSINSDKSYQHSNNNKGESTAASGSNTRRGKINSESKVQAARNKHKNNQNKEKHSSIRIHSLPEATSRSHSTQLSEEQHINGQKQVTNIENDIINNASLKNKKEPSHTRNKAEYQENYNDHHKTRQINANTKLFEQSFQEINLNSIIRNRDQINSENKSESHRKKNTPESTSSSISSEDSINNMTEKLIANNIKEKFDPVIMNSMSITETSFNSSLDDQINSSGLYNSNSSQSHINHRSIFQTDNNSFFSSNTFQKISNIISLPPNVQNTNDWTTTCLTSIPDSFPSVHSSEDWQAAFGFHPEISQTNHQTALPSPGISLNSKNFLDDDNGDSNADDNNDDNEDGNGENDDDDDDNDDDDNDDDQDDDDDDDDDDNDDDDDDDGDNDDDDDDDDEDEDDNNEDDDDDDNEDDDGHDSNENKDKNGDNHDGNIYLHSEFNSVSSTKICKNLEPNTLITTASSASKFMADFQQHSHQQRLILQNQENCDYIKQNGHSTENSLVKQEYNTEIKTDDDLGFDPFHETQKALAELMENEMQLQQQRLFQQQHQSQQRNREEQSRSQSLQQQYFTPSNFNSQHFTQVAHLAQLQQAHHLQNLQVLQQSHTLMSRLPQNILQQANIQSSVQSTMSVVGGCIEQRSRLPPPGFPSSIPNHMNSFGLGIPRAASTNNTLVGTQTSPNSSYLSNGVNKFPSDSIYNLKDWCEIAGQQQLQQQFVQSFHHQPLHQKVNWNNFGPIADWTSIDPAIVSSSRPLQFQATSTWQISRFHPSTLLNGSPNTQQEQHWAMQPPPGFSSPISSTSVNGLQSNTSAQPHTKLISAGSEIENC